MYERQLGGWLCPVVGCFLQQVNAEEERFFCCCLNNCRNKKFIIRNKQCLRTFISISRCLLFVRHSSLLTRKIEWITVSFLSSLVWSLREGGIFFILILYWFVPITNQWMRVNIWFDSKWGMWIWLWMQLNVRNAIKINWIW